MNTTTPPTSSVTSPEPVVRPQKRPLLAWVLLVVMALVWGTSFILIKHSLTHFSTNQVAAGRIFFAFLFFVPFMAYQIRQPEVRQALRQRWPALLGSGVLGYLLPAHLFAEAGAHLNSSLSGALNSLSPLFTLLIGAALFRQPVRSAQVAGILIGFGGSLLLVLMGATGRIAPNGWAGLIVLATIMYGTNINLISKYLSHLPAIVSTTWTFALVGPLAGLSLLATNVGERVGQPGSGPALGAIILLGVLASGITSVIFNRVVQLASGVFASSVTYLMPIVALFWGLFDGERIYVAQYIGMATCLFGVYLVNRRK